MVLFAYVANRDISIKQRLFCRMFKLIEGHIVVCTFHPSLRDLLKMFTVFIALTL